MAMMEGKQIGLELCEALGLEANKVRRIGLEVTSDGASLLVEYRPTKDEWGRVIATIQKYFPVTL